MLACSPFIAKKAKPTIGRTVRPKPIPKPNANPNFLLPSSSITPLKDIFCPSVAVVETQLTLTYPALPHPLAFFF